MKNISKRIKAILIIITLSLTACNDFIDVGSPKTEIVTETVFVSDVSATSAVLGIYSLMMTNTGFTKAGIEEYAGISSDELISYSSRADQLQFFQNSLTTKNTDVLSVFWREAYRYINNANSTLEGLNRSNGVSAPVKNQLEGEARFIRAFCYFYLVNLFGEVPYFETTDYSVTSIAPRNSVDEVYQKIEFDLLVARDLLVNNFSFSRNERIQPNQGTATALLARLYLYRQEWNKAELMSSELINQTATYSLVSDLNKVFLPNSQEAIWQLKPVVPGASTPQANLFILTGAPNTSARRLTLGPTLVNSFDVSDKRKTSWIGTFSNSSGSWNYSYKYKVVASTTPTEYAMVFRLAEQYLIRAEARARLNNLTGANQDVNIIRTRAGLPTLSGSDQTTVLGSIERERQKELFTEWGHRWLDLKRTNRASDILMPLKPNWQVTDMLFPIPDAERVLNPNLSQNPSY